jgi:alkanesulfonate monooxygenase SsuD/methylene tetrahydromethanopterin reductase-like flavin-dependent oxidoreductase (luciferase family)
VTTRLGFLAVAGIDPLSAGAIREIESLGIDSMWGAGHIISSQPLPEAVTSVAWLAASTERVLVGSAVLVLPLYHPVTVAKQFAELDRATGGRIALGVGVGNGDAVEFGALGVLPSERGPRADESIEVIRALWSGTPVTREGNWWPLEAATVLPPPVRAGGPPIYVAGRKPPAVRRAAAAGDGWFPFLFSPSAYARSVAEIGALASNAGRSLEGFEWLCLIYVRVEDDTVVAQGRAKAFLASEMGGDPEQYDSLASRICAVGAPAEVADMLRQYVSAGVGHVVVRCCAGEEPDFVEQCHRIVEEVVPLLGE